MNRMAAVCVVVMLLASIQSSVYACCSVALYEDQAPVKAGTHWTLSSRWRWNASGVGDHAGSRVETENWNDTLTIQEVSGGGFSLRLKRVGNGSLDANGSFIISGRTHDFWTIDREYTLKVNATTFRDLDGRPVQWISNMKELESSRSVPEMWTDKDYHYVEVRYRISGSGRFRVGEVAFDTWIVSYRNLTTGYWSAEGNHSTGFKEETLEYDQTRGLLLQDTYHGAYGMKTRGGGWNETETFAATTIDSNLTPLSSAVNTYVTVGASLIGALVVAAIIASLVILRRRKIRGHHVHCVVSGDPSTAPHKIVKAINTPTTAQY